MIWTPLCDLLGIEHPILQGGMAWAATAELAAAVFNAGGLGVVGAGDAPVETVRRELKRVRSLTDKPFGANVPLCTTECQAHGNYKRKIVKVRDRSTVVTGGSFGHPVRSIRGQFIRHLDELERRGVSEEEFLTFGAGTLRMAIVDGNVDRGSVMAGQSAGLVDDVVPVKRLIERIVAEAEAIIRRGAAQIRGQRKASDEGRKVPAR